MVSLSYTNFGRLQDTAGAGLNRVPQMANRRIQRSPTPFGDVAGAAIQRDSSAISPSSVNRTDVATIRRSAAASPVDSIDTTLYSPPLTQTDPPRAASSEAPPTNDLSTFRPAFLEPDNTRFNSLDFAASGTAEFLAERFGGKVGDHQYKWMTGMSVTPGVSDVLQPPSFATIDFGYTQVNAGLLASYYRPGASANPDAKAAETLYRAGVRNDFVLQNLPAYLRNVPMDVATNPLTGESFQPPDFPGFANS